MAVINVDMDGVVYDFVRVMWREARIAGVEDPVRPEDIDPLRSVHEQWGMTRAEFEKIMHFGITQGRVFGPGYDLEIPGARDALNQLHDAGHFIRIVTNKAHFPAPVRTWAIKNTVDFLHLRDIPYDDIVFVRADKTAYSADVVIDDRPMPTRWAQPGAINILFDQPHNRQLTPEEMIDVDVAAARGIEIIRFALWPDIVDYIERRTHKEDK